MNMHIADNHDAMLDYLYEEGDPAARLKIAQHLQECAECSVAMLEFQSVRGMLREWAPPATDLGFRLVQDKAQGKAIAPAAIIPRVWRSGWMQAAAAVLLFAAGMAVSQLNVDYANGTLTVRSGPAVPPAAVQNVSAPIATQAVPSQAPVDVDALERELRARLTQQNASPVDTEQLLQRVRAMIDQSEQRQQRVLALRLSQVAGEVDAQHQADLMRLQQSVGQTQEVMDYLVRTSGGVK